MLIGTTIEIKRWGDDNSYTDCIMVTEEKRDVKEIEKIFLSKWGLNKTSGLPYDTLSFMTDEFIKYLKKEGFSQLKTHQFLLCD